jgi:hypothetical protein
MMHLVWVLSSFVFPMQFSMFLCLVFLVPVYSWEFSIVYGMEIPYLKDRPYYTKYRNLYPDHLQRPVLELALYFLIMTLCFMSVSSFKLLFDYKQEDVLKVLFTRKILSKNSTIRWRFLFFILKNIQILVLIVLFINGSGNLNKFKNLGFMIFFIAFTSSEQLYRKTGWILTLFIAFFIYGQYYYSLYYHDY